MIPRHLEEALQLYVEQRIQPCHFLTACLENDLKEAIGRADDNNRLILVQYIYNEIPSACWGSPAKVTAWLEGAP